MADPDQLIHGAAIVEAGAQIGDDTTIAPWVRVMANATIGARCVIEQGCVIGNVTVGDGCRIATNVSLVDGVTLEADVLVGPSAVFTNVTHPRAHVERAAESTRVRRGATIGASATILCGVVVGPYAMVGAGAVVVDDVPAHAVVVGNPAQHISWACRCGETLFPDFTCGRCDDGYVLDGGKLSLR